MSIIREAESRNKGWWWKVYDENFRIWQACSLQSWAKINPDLWLRVMTSSQSNVTDTNLGSAVAFRPPAQRTGVCFDYNNKECYYRICRYAHKCSACRGDHPVKQCNRMVKNSTQMSLNFCPFNRQSCFRKN